MGEFWFPASRLSLLPLLLALGGMAGCVALEMARGDARSAMAGFREMPPGEEIPAD